MGTKTPRRWGRGLTMRAADGGYAPRFLAFFLALSFFRFDGEATLPPTAANASRWAAYHMVRSTIHNEGI